MILNVRLVGNSVGSKFIKQMEEKCEALPFPFFNVSAKEIPTMQGSIYIMDFTWKIMRPYWICIFPIIAALFFQKLFLLYIAAGILALEFFLSDWFVYLIFKLGLKRAGYKGSIKYLSRQKALEAICENV